MGRSLRLEMSGLTGRMRSQEGNQEECARNRLCTAALERDRVRDYLLSLSASRLLKATTN